MRFTVVFAISIIACTLGTPSAQEPVRDGVWGGKGIQMTVTAEGAAIDYGCDSGTIEGSIQTDSKGKFHARGTHVFGRGGPRKPGEPIRKPHDARYEGVRRGNKIELNVLLPELNRNLGKFDLKFGEHPTLERCG